MSGNWINIFIAGLLTGMFLDVKTASILIAAYIFFVINPAVPIMLGNALGGRNLQEVISNIIVRTSSLMGSRRSSRNNVSRPISVATITEIPDSSSVSSIYPSTSNIQDNQPLPLAIESFPDVLNTALPSEGTDNNINLNSTIPKAKFKIPAIRPLKIN